MRDRHMFREDDPTRRAMHPLRPTGLGSAAHRLAWAVAGTAAFFAAAHVFGWW